MDLIIRGARVADGSGAPAVVADVGIAAGRIAALGHIDTRASIEIDARGLLLAPGFVDIHTHFDGQAMWEPRFLPSSHHGVTTIVMGNCGVGFAPVRPADHNRLVELMEGVEDIPGPTLHAGLDWCWESFAAYLGALERIPHDIDYAAYLPHAALRVYVMGERAARLEPATAVDIARMRALTAEAVRAGAMGVSTSRSINHRTSTGESIPTLGASAEELVGLALGLRDAGAGVFQLICDFDDDVDAEFALLRRVAEVSGRPVTYSLMQKHGKPDGWRRLLDLTAGARAAGLEITAQVAPRGVGVLLGMQSSRHIFIECPSYQKVAHLPLAGRVAALAAPELRATLLAEIQATRHTRLGKRLTEYANIYLFGEPPDYVPAAARSIAGQARALGRDPAELACELMLANGGRDWFYSPFANFAAGDIEVCAAMLRDPNTVVGLGDGGAHVAMIADASFPTFLLSYWGRERGAFPIEWLI